MHIISQMTPQVKTTNLNNRKDVLALADFALQQRMLLADSVPYTYTW